MFKYAVTVDLRVELRTILVHTQKGEHQITEVIQTMYPTAADIQIVQLHEELAI